MSRMISVINALPLEWEQIRLGLSQDSASSFSRPKPLHSSQAAASKSDHWGWLAIHHEERPYRVLLADDEESILWSTQELLKRRGWDCVCATSAREALELLAMGDFDVLVADYKMPGNEELELLETVSEDFADLPVIVITGYPSIRSAVTALQRHAFDYVTKPLDMDYLTSRIEEAAYRRRLKAALRDSEDKYRLLLENTDAAIAYLGVGGQVILVNKMAANLFGCLPEDIIGQHISEVAPRISNAIMERITTTVRTGEGDVFEDYVTLPIDTRWFWSSWQPVRGLRGEVAGVQVIARDITNRKMAEEASLASEQLYQELFDNVPLGLFRTTPDGCFLDANPAFLDMLGYPDKGTLLGQPAPCIWADAASHKEWRYQLDTHALIQNKEIQMVRFDGQAIWALVSVRVAKDMHGEPLYLEGSAADISERREIREAIQQNEAFFAAVFDGIDDGICIMDSGLLVTRVNRWIEERYAKEMPLAGKPCTVICMLPDRNCPDCPARKAMDTGATATQIHPIPSAGPVECWIEKHCYPLRDNTGAITGSIVFIRDISARKRAEEERIQLEQRIQQALKNESLGILAGGIAHEFNNLLMGVLGNADLAMHELSQKGPGIEYLAEIGKAAMRAAELSRQMLTYTGRSQFKSELVDVNALIRQMSQQLKASISSICDLRTYLMDELPAIPADAAQIRQVLLNLVANASEAIGESPGAITISTSYHEPGAAEEASYGDVLEESAYLCIEVSDTGCGMNEAVLNRVFDPFFSTKFTGRGLGLATVQGIIRAHKGKVLVSSEPGHGTTFAVFLPCQAASDAKCLAVPAAFYEQPHGSILVVDDDETVRDVVTRMLDKTGLPVVCASNGWEAAELLEQTPYAFSCVLLDLVMPVMSGHETFCILKRIRPDLPVILSTGYNEAYLPEQFSPGDLAGHLSKPFGAERLRWTIWQALSG